MSKPRGAKRLYLINRDFQYRYIRMAVVVGLVSTFLTLFLLLVPLYQFNIIRFPGFLPAPFLWAIVVAAFFNFLIIGALAVLITHRIAGPMFALVRHMRLMQLGRATPHLKLRTSDDLKFVVRHLNDLIDYLHSRAGQDKSQIEALVALLDAGDHAGAKTLAELIARDFEARATFLTSVDIPAEGAKPA